MFRPLNHIVSIILLAVFLSATGCSSAVPSFYTVDVRQGNYLDQTMIEQLRIGMSKRQVRAALGTPLISDPFHQQRWDYVYSYLPDGDVVEHRHISLFFEGDTLARIEGDVQPQPPAEG